MSYRRARQWAGTWGAVAVLGLLSGSAEADVTHVVARGHTVEAIANRYRVPAKVILEANHIANPQKLKVGDALRIPGVDPPKPKASANPGSVRGSTDSKPSVSCPPGRRGCAGRPVTYAMRPKVTGLVQATRLATRESFEVKVSERRGKQNPAVLKAFERMLRSQAGLTHPVEPRLVALLGLVSNHFGGRRIEIVSGFRPYSPAQHTPHSNHNVGKAIDFRVQGVPNEVVRDYCRTLRNVGVGYYPNSTFVHLDARATSAFWIDYARPGEAPHYNSPNVEADEGASDVFAEARAAGDDVGGIGAGAAAWFGAARAAEGPHTP